jgi:uncharacterized protein YcgL (UPF0745 family)
MLCSVLRSETKEYHYVYLAEEIEFDDLPESLQQLFGQAEQFMQLDLDVTKGLANADIDQVRKELTDKGFYLQMPPDISVEALIAKQIS